MAINKQTDLGFAVFNYWRIDKDTPMIPLPNAQYSDSVKGIATIKINLYLDRQHSLDNKPVKSINVDTPLNEFSVLWHNNTDDYIGCLYAVLTKLPEWSDGVAELEEGQKIIQ